MKRIVLSLALASGLVLAGGVSSAFADRGPHAGPSQPGMEQPGERMKHRGKQLHGKKHRHRQHKLHQRLVQRFDRDGDGQLTGDEKRAARQFARQYRQDRRIQKLRQFDADRNGWLSPDEQRAARQAFKAKRQQRRREPAGS